MTKAIEHLNPNVKNSVIGKYNAQLDAAGDSETRRLREIIYTNSDKIDKNSEQIDKIEDELSYYD